jgi:hypothetical protein
MVFNQVWTWLKSSNIFGQDALILREWDFDLQVLRQSYVDGKDRPIFFPLHVSGIIGLGRGWQIQCTDHFIHGCIIQSQEPSVNRTATALSPS